MQNARNFLPMSKDEMKALGWDELDILIVSGDAYVDHPSFGAAIIGRFLQSKGFRVGILAQPDWRDVNSFTVMGRPRLFCGVTAGNLDSMLAHYTAAKKKRHDDAYTPGGSAGLRPNYPTVVYTQMIKAAFPGIPVVLGGIEASMRRSAHYDFWENKVKPSILVNSKADLLVYGMGEKPILQIAENLQNGITDFSGIRGTARLLGSKASKELEGDYNFLPSYELCLKHKKKLFELTKQIEKELNPFCGKAMVQMHSDRALIIEPPSLPLSQSELDEIYNLPFTGLAHWAYDEPVPAWTMVKDSITIVRGCAGGCSFCSLGLHQGKFIVSRSIESVLKEIHELMRRDSFRGTVSDLGGPTANLYGCKNAVSVKCRGCRRPSCLYPEICKFMKLTAADVINLYRAVRKMAGVKHVFVNSGIRMDVAVQFPQYIKELVSHHVSGHLKVAPEHFHSDVLRRMRKPDGRVYREFARLFEQENKKTGKEQYLVPYFISGFPGCTDEEMSFVEEFLLKRKWNLQQVQSFIPLPMTAAAAMYYSGIDYNTDKPLRVIKNTSSRLKQKEQLTGIDLDNPEDKKTGWRANRPGVKGSEGGFIPGKSAYRPFKDSEKGKRPERPPQFAAGADKPSASKAPDLQSGMRRSGGFGNREPAADNRSGTEGRPDSFKTGKQNFSSQSGMRRSGGKFGNRGPAADNRSGTEGRPDSFKTGKRNSASQSGVPGSGGKFGNRGPAADNRSGTEGRPDSFKTGKRNSASQSGVRRSGGKFGNREPAADNRSGRGERSVSSNRGKRGPLGKGFGRNKR